MNCNKCRDLLPLKATGDLDRRELEELKSHLAECAGCRDEAAEYSQLTATLIGPDADELTELERIKLENDLLRRAVERRTNRQSLLIFSNTRYLVRAAASIALVVSGFLLNSLLGDWTRQSDTNADRTQLVLATIAENPTVAAGHRFSAAGLRLIARGKAAIADQ